MITSIPGSSQSFQGGVVAYSNEVKQSQLRVTSNSLAQHGAVSEAVVLEMARGVKQALGADWGVSTSGIAGPTGGTEAKPVGTVWMAVSGPNFKSAWCHNLGRQRERIVERASRRVLTQLFQAIQQERLDT